jgi:hypothetical protein
MICTLSKPWWGVTCDYWRRYVCLSILAYLGDSHWMDCRENPYLEFLPSFVYLFGFWLKTDQKKYILHEGLCTFGFIALIVVSNSLFSARYALRLRKQLSIEYDRL